MVIDLLYIFLLFVGVYRYWDGCRRLKRAPDMAADTRYQQIPDSDVVVWWQKLTQLDQKFGVFFQRYGLFLIVISLCNLLLNWKTEVDIPLNGLTILLTFGFAVIVLIGWAIMGNNSGRAKSSPVSAAQDASYSHTALAFAEQQESFYRFYTIQEFRPKSEWQDIQGSNHAEPAMYYPISTILGVFNDYLNGVRYIKLGAYIYYGAWLIVIAMTTIYHIWFLLK